MAIIKKEIAHRNIWEKRAEPVHFKMSEVNFELVHVEYELSHHC